MKFPRVHDVKAGAEDRGASTTSLLPGAEQKKNRTEAPTVGRKNLYDACFKDWWLFELGSLALGIGALIYLIILLKRYENERVPEMGSIMGVGITLNTVVSILATIGRASLLLPVAECISQQKWVWFSGSPRPLVYMDTFDQGSRGAFGSLVMLWKINIRNLGSIGALLLILGLAVDPLSQQLLHYETRAQPTINLDHSSAYVNTAYRYGDELLRSTQVEYFTDLNNTMLVEPPLSMKAAIQAGIYDNSSGILELPPICSTGNCTWEPYESLAVCMKWADVSPNLQRSVGSSSSAQRGQIATWSLNNRTLISGLDDQLCRLNISSTSTPWANGSSEWVLYFDGTSAFKGSPSLMADFFVTYRNGSSSDKILGSNFSTIEFMLEWCVQNYKTDVKHGVATTTRLEAANDFRDNPGILVTDRKYGPDYEVGAFVRLAVNNYLRKAFSGSVSMVTNEFNGSMPMKTTDAAEAFHAKLKTKPDDYNTGPEDGDVRRAMVKIVQNVATSMTNAIRQQGALKEVEGMAWQDQIYVKVQWGWIAAPAILAFFSVLFVIATIVQASGQAKTGMVWKSSSVPMFVVLSQDIHKEVRGANSLSETERVLKNTKVSLARNGEKEWRLHRA